MAARTLSATEFATSDGRTVRLAGVEGPEPPSSSSARPTLATQAQAALAELVQGQSLTLHPVQSAPDRWGRLVAQVVRGDGSWLQGELLSRGWVRVHTAPDDRALAAEMLALEDQARVQRAGVWRSNLFAVRTPETVGRASDSFQIVEGTVLSASWTRNQLYLNFGPDWRSDFTIRIGKPLWRSLPAPLNATKPAAQAAAVATLAGQRLRVRGWVSWRNGPLIDLSHREQLELLAPQPSPQPQPAP